MFISWLYKTSWRRGGEEWWVEGDFCDSGGGVGIGIAGWLVWGGGGGGGMGREGKEGKGGEGREGKEGMEWCGRCSVKRYTFISDRGGYAYIGK